MNQKFNLKKTYLVFTLSFLVAAASFVNIAQASPITEGNIIVLVNQERIARGLLELNVDPELTAAARMKSRHMLKKNYFAHYAYGLTPWFFMKNAGYDYMLAGENLAMDFNTSEGIVRAWMASEKHRENILNPEFADLGVGVVKGAYFENDVARNTAIITNMFGQRKPAIIKAIESVRKFFNLY